MKYTDSIFNPSKDYILRYGNIKKEIEKAEDITDKSIQTELQFLKDEEAKLSETAPSLKRIVIEFIKEQINFSLDQLPAKICSPFTDRQRDHNTNTTPYGQNPHGEPRHSIVRRMVYLLNPYSVFLPRLSHRFAPQGSPNIACMRPILLRKRHDLSCD
jgi:hypothetical protein